MYNECNSYTKSPFLRCGQAWRAAALEGWRLSHDPNFSREDSEEQAEVDGNTFRDVWKYASWSISQDVSRSIHQTYKTISQ